MNFVLTICKMAGSNYVNGQKKWVPNIKLPDNAVYYDVVENET